MTTHIFKEHLFHPKTARATRVAKAQRMMCGALFPMDLNSYVQKDAVLRDMNTAVIYPQGKCDECFNHPEIQLLILANTDLGDE